MFSQCISESVVFSYKKEHSEEASSSKHFQTLETSNGSKVKLLSKRSDEKVSKQLLFYLTYF